MCEYCDEPSYERNPLYTDSYSDISIDENELDITYYESFGYTSMYYRKVFKINYCPMCGRELK